MKNILIKTTTFLFIGACLLGKNTKAMFLDENEFSSLSPGLMFEDSLPNSLDKIKQRRRRLSSEWDKLYDEALTKGKEKTLESDDSVPQKHDKNQAVSVNLKSRTAIGQQKAEVQEIAQTFPPRLSLETDHVQPNVGKNLKSIIPPTQEEILTRKEVKDFVCTFPPHFNPEKADLQNIFGDTAIKTSSAVWKLTTFLYWSNQTGNLQGQRLLSDLPDNKTEKHSYEVSYKSPNTKERWSLMLTFYPSR